MLWFARQIGPPLLTMVVGLLATQGFTLSARAEGMVRLDLDAVDASAGNVPCLKIETPTATYFLEKQGAGLSSLVDKDGHDWIGFHNTVGSGPQGEYRGFPNAVHRQDGNFFHPKNKGTGLSKLEVTHRSDERVTVVATSVTNTWQARWDFVATHCTFTMTRMPRGRQYWILYEGVPGGQYDATDWWMTSAVKAKQPLTKRHAGDIPAPEWIAFGDRKLNRALFLHHHEDDDKEDRFYQMGGKMTVFGFGRSGLNKHLADVPRHFTIGLVETTDHARISVLVAALRHVTGD